MPRRRVNKKLIVIGAAVSVVLAAGLGGAAYYKLVYTRNPVPHLQAAERFMSEGKYEQAVEEYAQAIRKKDNDPMVWVKLGDAQNYLAGEDPTNLNKARGLWENAITQNPKLLEGHRRLLGFWRDFADASTGANRATYLDRAATVAQTILRLAPQDKDAAYIAQAAVVESWLADQPMDPQRVTDALAEMAKLREQQPENPDIPFTIARAQARFGLEALRRGDRQEAQSRFTEAMKLMDEALAARPDDPLLMSRKAKLLSGIGPRMDPEVQALAASGDTKATDALFRKKVDDVNKRVAELSVKAASLVKPEDKEYVETILDAALAQQRAGDTAAAEKTLRDLIERRPDELAPRLALVELVRTDGKRLNDAIELLSSIPPQTKVKSGVAGLIAKDGERRATVLLCDLKLDQFLQTRDRENDPAKAQTIMKEAEQLFAKASSGEPDSPRVLRLRGKMELFKGDAVPAVQTLNRALQGASDPNDRTRYEVMYLLARAYVLTEQTGEAERLYREITERLEYVPARVELARLLLRKAALDEAQVQIDAIRAVDPDNPDAIALELARQDIDRKNLDPKQFASNFRQLPEKTAPERVRKARIALAANTPEMDKEAMRLSETLLTELPEERVVVALAATSMQRTGQNERAVKVLNEFLAKFPESPQLKILLRELMGASAGELDETRLSEIQKLPEPQRQFVLYEFYRRRNDVEKMKEVVAELERVAPNDPQLLELRFQQAIIDRDYARAESLVEPIARANADKADGQLARARLARMRAQDERDPELKKQKQQQAVEAAQQLTQSRGEFATAWVSLGQALQDANRLEEAIAAYQQAYNRQAQSIEALDGLIRCNYLLKRPEETKRYIDIATSMFPKSQLFTEYMVSWEVQFGDPNKVIPIREQNLKDNSGAPLAYGNLGAAYEAAARRAKTPEEAKALREKGREVFARGVAKFPEDAGLVAGLGDMCLLTDQFDEGLKAWRAVAAMERYRDQPQIAIRVANYCRRGNRPDEAIAYLNEFLSRVNDAGVRVVLADLLLGKQQSDEAIKVLEAAGDDPRAVRRRSEMLMGAGKMDEARSVVEQALSRNPGDTALTTRLAFILLSSGKPEEARSQLQAVLAKDPRDTEAMFYLALLDAQKGDLDRAIAGLQTIRDLTPENTDALKLLADLFRRRNNNEAATDALEQVLRVSPEDKNSRIMLIEMAIAADPPKLVDAERLIREGRAIPALAREVDLLHAEARMLYVKGDYKGAMVRVQAALQANPTQLSLQDTYFRILMADKQYQTAVQSSTALLQQQQLPWIYSTRATAYARLKQNDKALADFEAGYNVAAEQGDDAAAAAVIRALAGEIDLKQAVAFLEPRAGDNRNKKILLAQLHAQGGEIEKAIAIGESLMPTREQMRPPQRQAYLKFMGSVYLSQRPTTADGLNKARAVYDEYLKATPNDYEVLNNVAYAMMLPQSGVAPDVAVTYSQRAYDEMNRANRNDPLVMDTHGAALVRAGRVSAGINVLRDALARKQFPDGYIHLAEGLLKNNELSEAASSLDRAEDLVKQEAATNGQGPDPEQLSRINDLRQQIDVARQRGGN